jgi:hypothetical protein
MLIVGAIAEGLGVLTQWTDIARRVRSGEVITDKDIDAARDEVRTATARWDAAAPNDKEN